LEQISAGELADQPLVCREKNSTTALFVKRILTEANVSRNVVARFDTFEGLKSAVRLGLGMAFVPKMSIRQEAVAGQFHTLRLADLEMTCTLKLLYLHLDNPVARCFITNCLATEFPHLLTQLFLPSFNCDDHSLVPTPETGK
jgi:DNA-binding transcriptional LysR family regulator